MKRIPLFFRFLFASMLLGLLVVSCQKDSMEVTSKPEAAYVLPAEFDGIFTEAELAEFYAGPTEAMRARVRDRSGTWHRMAMYHSGVTTLIPFVDDCEDPTPCPTCYDLDLWKGLVIHSEGPGMWFGKGPLVMGADGVNCFLTGELDAVGWMNYQGSMAYGQLTELSTVTGRDGSVVELWRGDIIEGTGIFENLTDGYLLHRMYRSEAQQPFVPGPYFSYSIGWMFY